SLLLKLALVAVLVALGAINLLVMRPRLSRARQSPGGLRAARTFRVLVLSEVMLGGGVLGATALLASLPPPGAQGLPGPIDAARRSGDLRVQLTIDPNWVGQSRFRVALTDAQ